MCRHVRRGDKENLREIVVHVEVVILKGGVLLGIEDFEQRRSRIAAEVGSHLVYFVEKEDRVLGAGALHVLNDLAGQCADVGAAMPANLCLIAHSAEREANELASQWDFAIDMPSEVLPTPGGPTKQRIEPLGFFTS